MSQMKHSGIRCNNGLDENFTRRNCHFISWFRNHPELDLKVR